MKLLIPVLTVLCVLSQANADTYSSVGGTTIVSGPNGTYMSGPNGTMIVTSSNTDAISGTWTSGISVGINQVLGGNSVPSKLHISDFDMKMSDGNSLTVLALTPEEGSLPNRSDIVWTRAKTICGLSKIYPYAISVNTTQKWFSGLLINVAELQTTPEGSKYPTYKAGFFSGARYFTDIVCSTAPRNY